WIKFSIFAEGRQLVSKRLNPGMSHSAAGGNTVLKRCVGVGGSLNTTNIGGFAGLDAAQALSTAQAEVKNLFVAGRILHAGRLGSNKRFNVKDIKDECFQNLGFNNRAFHPHERGEREHDFPFFSSVNIYCETKVAQIGQTILMKSLLCQELQFILIETKIIKYFSQIRKTGKYYIAALKGIAAKKIIEGGPLVFSAG